MFKKIALSLLAVVAVFLGYVALKSPDYEYSREISINAPAEKIFPYLNNQKLAEQWGPWMEIQPGAPMSYSGPETGVGSRTSWNTTGQLGVGSATIVGSVPNQRVDIKLEYTKPMEMSQDSVYAIRSEGGQSIVTWRVTGKNGFLGRLMCTVADVRGMMDKFFDKGLSKLKTVVEKG